MGFENRPYFRDDGGGWRPRPNLMGMLGLPSMGPMVARLMVINAAVFIIQLLAGDPFDRLFAARGLAWTEAIQLWRLITFQFLHASFLHLLLNMMGLYFFGTPIEQTWGSRRFLWFYLTCGVVGGALFVAMNLLGYFLPRPGMETHWIGLVGASGGVLGVMAACAILYPQMKVILFPLPIPLPIRVLGVFIIIGYIVNIFRGGPNAGGDICHLGGMATAAAWIFIGPHLPRLPHLRRRRSPGAWRRRMEQEEKLRFEADRILAKVHEKGIHSLTAKEKDILQKATELQKTRGTGPYS